MNRFFYLIIGILFLSCCGKKNAYTSNTGTDVTAGSNEAKTGTAVKVPVFDADSAYSYVAAQVAFGPRVPNTDAHKACADYLASELERHGAKMYIQEAVLTAYNGDRLNAKNIIGAFNPDKSRRVMLFAHWDSRPYADQDDDEANHHKPIDGADDGGSGVGVLLEIARQFGMNAPDIGVDIFFFDAEDYGPPVFVNDYTRDPWALGTQFWVKNPHITNYKAAYGILLDMVGSKGATFYKEGYSVKYANMYVEKIWSTARNLGYGRYFVSAEGGMITDDHEYVIKGRGIPCVDIINLDPKGKNNGFGAHWHTMNDNMNIIDSETLKAVGQTVLEVIYND